MENKKILKWAVLVIILLLPFFIYFIFVYSAGETFFVKLGYVGPKSYTTNVIDGQEINDSTFYTVPQFEYTSQYDTAVSANELRGNIYLINFFFSSCPSICPAMNYNVQQIQERFKGYEDFKIISITVDPEHDSVEVLQDYARKMQAREGIWYFLTGNADSIYKTAEGFFASAMPDSLADGGFLHSENLMLVDWDGHIRSGRDEHGNLLGVYNGLQPTSIKTLKEDIKVLIAEHMKQISSDEHKKKKQMEKKDK